MCATLTQARSARENKKYEKKVERARIGRARARERGSPRRRISRDWRTPLGFMRLSADARAVPPAAGATTTGTCAGARESVEDRSLGYTHVLRTHRRRGLVRLCWARQPTVYIPCASESERILDCYYTGRVLASTFYRFKLVMRRHLFSRGTVKFAAELHDDCNFAASSNSIFISSVSFLYILDYFYIWNTSHCCFCNRYFRCKRRGERTLNFAFFEIDF